MARAVWDESGTVRPAALAEHLAGDRALYPAYELCQSAGIPLAVRVVMAHGGRGWWYDAAAFLTPSHDRAILVILSVSQG